MNDTQPAGTDGAARRRDGRVLFGAVAAVAGGIAVMAACGYYAFIWKTAIIPVLLLVALLARRLDRFANDWGVFLGLVILFDCLRGLIFALVTRFQLPVYMDYAIDWERRLCAGYVMPVLLQQLRGGLPDSGWLDRLLTIVHSSHFAFFLIFGLAVWVLRPGAFRRYAAAVVVVVYLGGLLYLVAPTVPPWMAASAFGVLPPIEHVTTGIYNTELPSLQQALDVNPIAAMPSLHAALPALCVLIAFHLFGRWAILLAAYAGLVFLAIMYLGEHYLVDVVAGIGLAGAVFALVYHVRPTVPTWPRWAARVRPIFVTVLLVVLAEAVGQLSATLARPFDVTPAFVERELVGRTPVAHLFVGRFAFERGDLRRARSEFERAAATLESPTQRQQAALWAGRTAYRQGDYRAVIDALAPTRDGDAGLDSLTLLAVAYIEAAQHREGETLLRELVARFPREPEPVYWLTRYEYEQRRLSAAEVRRVAHRLTAFPDSHKADRFRDSLLALASQ